MICFYHSADLDGHCSGAIVKKAYPEVELYGINYGDGFPWDKVSHETLVFMVDFSLQPFSDMERLLKTAGALVWLDHHKTAIEELKNSSLPWHEVSGTRVDGKAACELCWEHFFPNEAVPLAVYYLGRYDVWDHTNDNVLPFQYAMRMEDSAANGEIWKDLLKPRAQLLVADLLEKGHTVLKYARQENEKACKAAAFDTEFAGYRAIAINKPLSNSQTFDSVFDETAHDMMITFYRKRGQWTVSMYSIRDDVDVGAIAKEQKGGGHRNAAGFQCDELPFRI